MKTSVFILSMLTMGIITSVFVLDSQFQIFDSFFAFAQAQNNDKPEIPLRTPPNEQTKKIHSEIIKIMESSDPRATAELFRANYQNEKLGVYIHLKPGHSLRQNIEILDEYQNILYAKLPLNQIQSIASLDSVQKITLPNLIQTYVVSEGVSFTNADKMHTAGFTGNGVVVAVIDDSFFTNNTEIQNNILSSEFGSGCPIQSMVCDTGITSTNSHGTAVAEIVVDMAPDVGLRLFSIKTDLDFNRAVDNIIENYTDVDIITLSAGFPPLGGDGTNPERWYRDGTSSVAKKVNDATNSTNQMFFTVAAGNDGISHWMGNYSALAVTNEYPPNISSLLNLCPGCTYDTVMEFNSTAPAHLRACLPIEAGIDLVSAAWNDWGEIGSTTQDYDIMLYDDNMTAPLSTLPGQNDQLNGDPPFEIMNKFPSDPACLVVASFTENGTSTNSKDHLFHISSGIAPLNSTFRTLGSIDTPADASGAITVGAIDQATGLREDFSSQGPTDDGRVKPDICGPDNTSSSISELDPFFGTSAATPHTAGALALLLEENSTKNLGLNFTQIKEKLITDASFNSTYSIDNFCGSNSGALHLNDCAPPSSGDWIVDSSCTMNGNASVINGDLIVQDNSVLTVPAGVTLDIDFANHNLTVKFGSGVLIKSGGAIT